MSSPSRAVPISSRKDGDGGAPSFSKLPEKTLRAAPAHNVILRAPSIINAPSPISPPENPLKKMGSFRPGSDGGGLNIGRMNSKKVVYELRPSEDLKIGFGRTRKESDTPSMSSDDDSPGASPGAGGKSTRFGAIADATKSKVASALNQVRVLA